MRTRITSRPSALLIRPPPFPDESLSSWRQRTGWENLYRLFPTSDERTHRVDPDLAANEADLEYVELLHASDRQKVRSHTLRRWATLLGSRIFPHSHPQWWLGAGYGTTSAEHGSMYCPQCIAEDAIPYFRLRWRLTFVTSCDMHHINLRDTCPHCGRAPWPAGCGRKTVLHPMFTSFRNCWHCGRDLSNTSAQSIQDDQYLWTLLSHKVTNLGGISVATVEVFSAHRMVWRMLAKGGFRKRVMQAVPEWAAELSMLSSFSRSPKLDQLSVEVRAVFGRLSTRIFADGSASFVSFARKCGLRQMDFHEIKEGTPPWILEVISKELATNNHTVTEEDVEEAYRAIEQETGRRPTKSAVWKRLNWCGEKGTAKLFNKRIKATINERKKFVSKLIELALDESKGKRSARCNLVYACILLSCLLVQRDSKYLRGMSLKSKSNALDEFVHLANYPVPKSSDLTEAWIMLTPKVLIAQHVYTSDLLSEGTSRVVLRKCLVQAMYEMPLDLLRQLDVFLYLGDDVSTNEVF